MATQCTDYPDEKLLESVYECLETGQSLDTIHIPHSDVFFVREALRAKFPQQEYADLFTLEYVEELMRTELGWIDGYNSGKSQSSDEEEWLDCSKQTEENA
jgi:hypothetical protein